MEKFTSILNPIFDYLESGKLFRQPLIWLYYLIGVASCCFGIYKLFQNFDHFDYMPTSFKIYTVFMIVVLIGICVFSLIFWFRKASEVSVEHADGSNYLAIPIVANLLRTLGDYLGFVVAFFGIGSGVLTSLILSFEEGKLFFVGLGQIIGGVIGGYIIILLFRFLAEMVIVRVDISKTLKSQLKQLKKNSSK